jgi:hypothetical protein
MKSLKCKECGTLQISLPLVHNQGFRTHIMFKSWGFEKHAFKNYVKKIYYKLQPFLLLLMKKKLSKFDMNWLQNNILKKM